MRTTLKNLTAASAVTLLSLTGAASAQTYRAFPDPPISCGDLPCGDRSPIVVQPHPGTDCVRSWARSLRSSPETIAQTAAYDCEVDVVIARLIVNDELQHR